MSMKTGVPTIYALKMICTEDDRGEFLFTSDVLITRTATIAPQQNVFRGVDAVVVDILAE